jgi:hypothetical protein
MKTALATLVVALAAPIAVTAAPGVPDTVMSHITQNCNSSVAGNSQATESDEDCIARSVEAYQKSHR